MGMKKRSGKTSYNSNPQFKLMVKRAMALLKTDAYFDAYYQILAESQSDSEKISVVDAWVLIEQELHDLTDLNRYSDYQSFRNARYKYCCRQLKRY